MRPGVWIGISIALVYVFIVLLNIAMLRRKSRAREFLLARLYILVDLPTVQRWMIETQDLGTPRYWALAFLPSSWEKLKVEHLLNEEEIL